MKYKFRGKIVESDPWTVQQLNYALGVNGSKDRYVLVEPPKKGK
jgi:hypothetical protein